MDDNIIFIAATSVYFILMIYMFFICIYAAFFNSTAVYIIKILYNCLFNIDAQKSTCLFYIDDLPVFIKMHTAVCLMRHFFILYRSYNSLFNINAKTVVF